MCVFSCPWCCYVTYMYLWWFEFQVSPQQGNKAKHSSWVSLLNKARKSQTKMFPRSQIPCRIQGQRFFFHFNPLAMQSKPCQRWKAPRTFWTRHANCWVFVITWLGNLIRVTNKDSMVPVLCSKCMRGFIINFDRFVWPPDVAGRALIGQLADWNEWKAFALAFYSGFVAVGPFWSGIFWLCLVGSPNWSVSPRPFSWRGETRNSNRYKKVT